MKQVCFFLALFTITFTQAQDSTVNTPCNSFLQVYPVLWQQTSAEYKALCYQAFNIARLQLDKIPRRKLRRGKLAFITDLDETILDNSYAEAQLIKEGKEYSSLSWKNWVNMSAATAVPGAVEFLQYAKQKGITIFYISNRDTGLVASTLINLQTLQLPDADTAHMLFLSNTSSKESRRETVMKDYNVVMLFGDNLSDFASFFEKKDIAGRAFEADSVKELWGKKFIVLPNASYGDWENAVYDNKRNLTSAEKEKMRAGKLKDIDSMKK